MITVCESLGRSREAALEGRQSTRAVLKLLQERSKQRQTLVVTGEHTRLGCAEVTEDREKKHISPRRLVTKQVLTRRALENFAGVLDNTLRVHERSNGIFKAVSKSNANVLSRGTVVAQRKERLDVAVLNHDLDVVRNNRAKLVRRRTGVHTLGILATVFTVKLRVQREVVRIVRATLVQQLVNVRANGRKLEEHNLVTVRRGVDTVRAVDHHRDGTERREVGKLRAVRQGRHVNERNVELLQTNANRLGSGRKHHTVHLDGAKVFGGNDRARNKY